MNKGLLLAVMLTASLGKITFNDHPETWYNLKMDRVISRAQENGIVNEYWERADGCKMYGHYIVVAADWNLHPYGSIIQTSRGEGIVLDTHTANDRTTVDLAVTWGKGGIK